MVENDVPKPSPRAADLGTFKAEARANRRIRGDGWDPNSNTQRRQQGSQHGGNQHQTLVSEPSSRSLRVQGKAGGSDAFLFDWRQARGCLRLKPLASSTRIARRCETSTTDRPATSQLSPSHRALTVAHLCCSCCALNLNPFAI